MTSITMDAAGRRRFVATMGLGGAAALVGCHVEPEHDEAHGAIITPGEDLMGEHGIVRRVLVVWTEIDGPLRRGEPIDASALASSIDVIQWFIERYHEQVEEQEVFPRLQRAGREEPLVRTLLAQHEAGRAITRELAGLVAAGIDDTSRPRIATLLAGHARMYAAHASREDTVVFPTLRDIVGAGWADLGEQFDENEEHTIGEGGLERALAQVEAVERAFGLDDLAHYTPAAQEE